MLIAPSASDSMKFGSSICYLPKENNDLFVFLQERGGARISFQVNGRYGFIKDFYGGTLFFYFFAISFKPTLSYI